MKIQRLKKEQSWEIKRWAMHSMKKLLRAANLRRRRTGISPTVINVFERWLGRRKTKQDRKYRGVKAGEEKRRRKTNQEFRELYDVTY